MEKEWQECESITVDLILAKEVREINDFIAEIGLLRTIGRSSGLNIDRRKYAYVKIFKLLLAMHGDNHIALIFVEICREVPEIQERFERGKMKALFGKVFEQLSRQCRNLDEALALIEGGTLLSNWAKRYKILHLPGEFLTKVQNIGDLSNFTALLSEFVILAQDIPLTLSDCLVEHFISTFKSLFFQYPQSEFTPDILEQLQALFQSELFRQDPSLSNRLTGVSPALPQTLPPFLLSPPPIPFDGFPAQFLLAAEQNSSNFLRTNSIKRSLQEKLLDYLNAFKDSLTRFLTPDTKLVPYGSCPLGTYVPTSDINVTIVNPSIENNSRYLQLCCELLESSDFQAEVVHSPTGNVLKVWKNTQDTFICATINDQLALKTHELLATYLQCNKRGVQLISLVKIWLGQQDSGQSPISGFHITLLVLGFLQYKAQLPLLQDGEHIPVPLGEYDTWFKKRPAKTTEVLKIGHLVAEFFYWTGYVLHGKKNSIWNLKIGDFEENHELWLLPVRHPFTQEVIGKSTKLSELRGEKTLKLFREAYLRLSTGLPI